jgi:hypothetical protein
MSLLSKRRVELPAVLDLPEINWEGLYARLRNDDYANDPDGEKNKSRLRPWAVVSALLELYDNYRELDGEFQRFKAALPDWIVNGPPAAGKSSTQDGADVEGLRKEIEGLKRRVHDLESRGAVYGAASSVVPPSKPSSTLGRIRVLDLDD